MRRRLALLAALLAPPALWACCPPSAGAAAAQPGSPAGIVESWSPNAATGVDRYGSGLFHLVWAAPANPARDHLDVWGWGPVAALVRVEGQGRVVFPCGLDVVTSGPSAVATGPGGAVEFTSTGQVHAELYIGPDECGIRLVRV